MALCARLVLSTIRFSFGPLTFKLKSKFTIQYMDNIILHCLSRFRSLKWRPSFVQEPVFNRNSVSD